MGPVKLPFTDSNLAPLVKRYSSSTIVTMLREIAKCKTAKLDWVVLCKGTSTGITNPKEYQALWRSIAYRAELDDSYDENNDSPLEDDSDLEVELDPVPSVSSAVAESISSFVKSDLQQLEREEARLEQTAVQTGVGRQAGDLSTARLQQGSGLLGKSDNSAVATSARRLPYLASATQCAATQGESTATLTCSTSTKVPYSGAVNQADRKRRRLWTPEEDLALIAAVDKCGEGNWTTVLKNHYDFDRSASQLSQRWALIRKRREVQEKAGYGIGSGVSPLASGYKDLRPEGLKSGSLAGSGSQLGMPKDVGKVGNVPMSIKQPLSSTSSVPVSKRIHVASASETTSAAVLETQQLRALPTSGVSSSWVGQRPQTHGQASLRAGAAQVHKGTTPEGLRRPAQGPPNGSQVFYTSTQPSTIPIDSKYAASRNMGAGVARGGGSKGVHGPDPMIQAAAMAAGARIAPAATAASLLKAAQSGNVVHIGSGGLPRSKLGLTSQAGSGNAGGNPGIVHYIRTGSGGALAATSTGLQRTSSHHLAKNQSSRSSGSNSGSGNSSPLSVPTVPAQGSRNNPHALIQSSKPASLSKRGSSPQQKTASASNSTTSTPSPNPSFSTPPTPMSTPAPSSTATPDPNATSAPTPTSTLAPKSMSTPTPAPKSTSTSTPVSTSTSAPAPSSTSTPAPKSMSTPTPVSTSTSAPAPSSTSTPAPKSMSTPTPAPKSTSTSTPVSTSTSAPAPSSTSTPAPTATSTPALAHKSFSSSTPALPPQSTSMLTPALAPKSTSASAPAPSSTSIPAPTATPIPGIAPKSTSTPTPASTLNSIPASTTKSVPASTTLSAPASASMSTPAATPASTPASASASAPVSAPASAPVSTPASAPVSAPASAPASTPASAPASAPVSAIPTPAPTTRAPATTMPTPARKPTSTSVSIPACGFNTAGPGVESPGEEEKGEFSQLLKKVTMSAKF